METASSPRALAGRLLHGLGSQGLSSLSNFALVVALARTSSPRDFGAFSIAYSLALVTVLVIRAAVGETLAVTDSRQSRAALGAAFLMGATSAVVFGALGLIWPEPLLGRWLALFSVGLPLLVLQDGVRHVGFALDRPLLATIADGVWLAAQLLAWSGLFVAGWASPAALLITWWAAAGLAAAALLPVVGVPSVPRARTWMRERRNLAVGFSLGAVMYQVGSQGTVYAVGLVAGLPAAGALRGAQSVFGPVRSLAAGVGSIALPESTRRLSTDGRPSMMKYAVAVSTWLSVAALTALAVFVVAGDVVGAALLGDTWQVARPVVPAVGLTVLGGAAATGARLVLHSLHAIAWGLRLRVMATVMSVSFGIGGAIIGGLVVAAYGLAAAQLLAAALAWIIANKAGGSRAVRDDIRVGL